MVKEHVHDTFVATSLLQQEISVQESFHLLTYIPKAKQVAPEHLLKNTSAPKPTNFWLGTSLLESCSLETTNVQRILAHPHSSLLPSSFYSASLHRPRCAILHYGRQENDCSIWMLALMMPKIRQECAAPHYADSVGRTHEPM